MASAKAKPEITGIFAELREEGLGGPEEIVITDDIRIPMPTWKQIRAYYKAESADERLAILFGDQFDAVNELFDDKPYHVWQRFIRRVNAQVFGSGAEQVEGK